MIDQGVKLPLPGLPVTCCSPQPLPAKDPLCSELASLLTSVCSLPWPQFEGQVWSYWTVPAPRGVTPEHVFSSPNSRHALSPGRVLAPLLLFSTFSPSSTLSPCKRRERTVEQWHLLHPPCPSPDTPSSRLPQPWDFHLPDLGRHCPDLAKRGAVRELPGGPAPTPAEVLLP